MVHVGGQFFLRAVSGKDAGRCVQPQGGKAHSNYVNLVFGDRCGGSDRSMFEAVDTGANDGSFYLRNKDSSRCVHPYFGHASADFVNLIFHSGCDGDHLHFLALDGGNGTIYLRNKEYGRCVHSWYTPSDPQGQRNLIFGQGCIGSGLQFELIYASPSPPMVSPPLPTPPPTPPPLAPPYGGFASLLSTVKRVLQGRD